MANPTPEIMPEEALAAGAKIVGTGRSDYPNQINNVLAFPGLFKGALESGKQINVVSDQFRTPTLAEDLANGCGLIAEKKASGIYNISGRDFMSVFDLVYRVADFWSLDKSLLKISTSEGIKQPAKRPPITGFRIDKAVRELGYNPRSFEEGLAILNEQLHK